MADAADTGIAAIVGAALAGAIVGAREAIARRKRRKSEPPALDESVDDAPAASLSAMRARLRALTERVILVEQAVASARQEILMTRQHIDEKIVKLEESVDELGKQVSRSRTVTDEIIPLIKEQLAEIRADLREERRHGSKS